MLSNFLKLEKAAVKANVGSKTEEETKALIHDNFAESIFNFQGKICRILDIWRILLKIMSKNGSILEMTFSRLFRWFPA